MLEKFVGLEKMTIHQCEELAKSYDGKTAFDLCGPKGKMTAEWLDPHMGIFKIEGQDGFNMTRQFSFHSDLWCENLRPIDLNEPAV